MILYIIALGGHIPPQLFRSLPSTSVLAVTAVDTRRRLPEGGVIEYGEYQRLMYGRLRQHHRQLTHGAVGCYLSHIHVWQMIVGDFAVVFEEDARLTRPWKEIVDSVPWSDPWDVYLLGYASKRTKEIRAFLQTHAYIIRKSAVQKVMPHMFPVRQQIDWQLSELGRRGVIRIDGAPVQYAFQDKSIPSTVHPNGTSAVHPSAHA